MALKNSSQLPFYFAAAKKSYLQSLQYQLQLVYMIPADCIQLYTYSIYCGYDYIDLVNCLYSRFFLHSNS